MLHVVAGGLDGWKQQAVVIVLGRLVEVVEREGHDLRWDLDIADARLGRGFLDDGSVGVAPGEIGGKSRG